MYRIMIMRFFQICCTVLLLASSNLYAQVDLALNKVASASTATQPAANAVDGNAGTRWESAIATDPSWLSVDLGAQFSLSNVVIDWEAANAANYQIQGSTNGTTWVTLATKTGGTFGNRTDTTSVAGNYRYVRIYATARSVGNQWGYSIWSLKVYGSAASSTPSSSSSTASSVVATINLALGRITAASSALQAAANAVDGNAGTRWESALNADPSWISVDLGSAKTLSSVVIDWEAANAASYQVQGSNDNANWATLATRTGGAFGNRTDTNAVSGSYRYVRIYATARSAGNQWGYSIYELKVFGSGGVTSSTAVTSNSSVTSSSAASAPFSSRASSVTTSAGSCSTAPSVPTGLTATGVTSTGLFLSWFAPNPGANCTITGYRIFRNGAQFATPGGTNLSVGGLTASTSYSFTVAAVNTFGVSAQSAAVVVATSANSSAPNFGPNVLIFDPSIPTATIQSQINAIFAVQESNQFGTPRTALLFKPGTYNIDIPVGFFTHVIGLGSVPDQVAIASVRSMPIPGLGNNNGTQNFWRGVENFSVFPAGAGMTWAVSQAVPFRRMHVVNNNLTLHYLGGWTSGGWMADSKVDFDVGSGSQQQWISRNSQWGSWTGSLWNMVFVGIPNNLPGGVWPTTANTIVNTTPIVREKPFLYLNGSNYEVFVPALKTNSTGISWASGIGAGTSVPLDQFYLARSDVDTAATINAALSQGKHLLLTPGIYDLTDPIQVTRADTIVMGMGFATLHPTTGKAAITLADVDGLKISHLMIDAGATNSPVLFQAGALGSNASHTSNPTSISDVFIRIGGNGVAKATVSMQINSNDIIVDHTWIWRADHGAGAGWDSNTAQNGFVVNGNNVTAYGLFVEHFQQYQVLWNGNGGRTYFYQSEIPYDPPNQAAYSSGPGVNGWASYKVADTVTSHEAWGLGVYAVYTYPNVNTSRAIEAPNTPNVRFHHMVTVNLTANGSIQNVINNVGGATAPGIAITTPRVTDYPQ